MARINSKRKGRQGEERAIKALESEGFTCTLSHLSRGPWDVLAVDSERIRFVQVKVDDSKEWKACQPASVRAAKLLLDFPMPGNATGEYWVCRKTDGRYRWIMKVVYGKKGEIDERIEG